MGHRAFEWMYLRTGGFSILLLSFVVLSLIDCGVAGKNELVKGGSDQLCPSACSCSEIKSKTPTEDPVTPRIIEQDAVNENSTLKESKGSTDLTSKSNPDILKNGIRVQCQKALLITSVRKTDLPTLLVENMVQLDLSSNQISRLSNEDFSNGNYSLLQRLILKSNQIDTIESSSLLNLKNLKYLDLSNNLLKTFSLSFIEGMASLERIKLTGNPIYCDCQLSEFLTYALSHNIKLQGVCAEPAKLKDRAIARLITEELPCALLPDDTTIEIKPTTNQIVFEGDPLKLSCKLKTRNPSVALTWLQRHTNQTISITAGPAIELTLSSRNSGDGTIIESSLQVRHLLQEHGGAWSCASVLPNRNISTESRSVEVTVLSLSTPTCSSEVTFSNKGRYTWPRTMANVKITLPCQSNPHVQATRTCSASGGWEEADVAGCSYLNEVTKVLEQFAKTNLTFSKTSALESARRLKTYLTDVVSLTDPHDAVYVTQTLHNYLEASGKHTELLPIIMDVYSILTKQEARILVDSRHGLIGLLQQAPLKSAEFHYQSSSLSVEKCGLLTSGKPVASSSPFETCVWSGAETTTGSKISNFTPGRNRYQVSCSPNNQLNLSAETEASVRIPLIPDGLVEQSVVLSHSTASGLFENAQSRLEMVSAVLGVTSGHVTNLVSRTVPLVMTVRVNGDQPVLGARWNPYADVWSVDQCQTLNHQTVGHNHYVTFQCCCGFGFFAALTSKDVAHAGGQPDIRNMSGPPPLALLPPPIYVGSVICVLSHLTSLVCYLVHRKQLQMTQPTRHALVNGWLSTALLVLVFTLGIRPLLDRIACQLVGLLLHYLTLSCFLWMVVNASSLYKHLTKTCSIPAEGGGGGGDPQTDSSLMEEALGHDSPAKPALRFYLIGWGVPLIVVGIAGAIHLDQYSGTSVCFLAWTPSLGAVGLPSAILVFLILTFHLLSWCYLRHTATIAQRLVSVQTIAVQEAPPPPVMGGGSQGSASSPLTHRVLNQSRDSSNYLPLIGDGGSCPSNLTNLTQVTQVTEVSDLTSLSSCHEQERIALLIDRRGEAEGAQSANEALSGGGPSDIERPLLMVTSSSDDRLEEDDQTSKTEDDGHDHGHSNPLMASFTEESDAKKKQQQQRGAAVRPVPDPGPNPAFLPLPSAMSLPGAVDQVDETSPLTQLRGQLVTLILFCLMWLSALCVVTRPLKEALPYDELLSSLSYALFSAASGLHTLVFYLLTRNDVSAYCCFQKPGPKEDQKAAAPEHAPAEPSAAHPPAAVVAENAADKDIDVIHRAMDAAEMNVSLDPVTLVNSFFDPRQSKTARRFFQKQKLLHQNHHQENNNQLLHHSHPHHYQQRRHYNNSTISSHSPIAEEALLNASSSAKAKVSNVNIHVELGAYDWHELQSRMSDSSWTKSGKQLPTKFQNSTANNDTPQEPPVPVPPAPKSDKGKRKRHGHHHRLHKKSKWEDGSVSTAGTATEKPVYVFVNYDYRDRALAQVCNNDEALKTLTAVKIKTMEDSEDGSYLKRETSV